MPRPRPLELMIDRPATVPSGIGNRRQTRGVASCLIIGIRSPRGKGERMASRREKERRAARYRSARELLAEWVAAQPFPDGEEAGTSPEADPRDFGIQS